MSKDTCPLCQQTLIENHCPTIIKSGLPHYEVTGGHLYIDYKYQQQIYTFKLSDETSLVKISLNKKIIYEGPIHDNFSVSEEQLDRIIQLVEFYA